MQMATIPDSWRKQAVGLKGVDETKKIMTRSNEQNCINVIVT
jgi:hypothetical protein